MSYQQFGISPQLVERIKLKMKNPTTKERVKKLVEGLTKADLQDRVKVRRLVKQSAALMGEKLTSVQEEQIVQFVLYQKIDPQSTLHLIRLWSMFR
ncbi:stage VI sporulation protein F [Paenibacillus brevis]|uniref:Stage VI sporulation protein F n=1 Tax=Paenibacillus brevis TaxID=2841508 RepID=A0ABS6FUR6_9BACL|nr:stage VI sporulation protein F [Paenibacillus brevis]MBU5672900.1 stage VI sporulation protein F [Paenibacillus brevis]